MIMLMYALLAASFLLELLVVSQKLKKPLYLHFVGGIAIVAITVASSSITTLQFSLASAVLVPIAIVRCVNILRFIEKRMHTDELKRRGRRTFAATNGMSLLLLSYVLFLDDSFALSITLLLWLQLAVAILLGTSILFARTIYRYRNEKTPPSKLPTVSVCVPARNETQDLPECIESIIASTYPKLEILVLDDCSHDKTPDIIKRYAHAGVRFINGKEPRADWLAKNAAYDRLADEARGDILVFIGVDVRLQPNSVMELVSQLGDDSMLSVMPKRRSGSEAAFFIQPLRYWWELGLWRFSLKAAPVLSTCWAIKADVLQKLGTFESVKKAVDPEAVFARRLKAEKSYAFLVANNTVGVYSVKAPREQYITALRKRYAQLKRRPESVMVTILLEAAFILSPWLLVVWSAYAGITSIFVPSLLVVILLGLANTEVYKLALNRLWPLGFISMPALVLADMALLLRSLYAYEFGEVVWKERNICLPLLTVEKSLPKLD